MERSPLCTLFLRKCCGQPQLREKDDGEWMEPIDAKKRNKRHYSVVKEGGGVQTKQTNAPPNFEKARSINWADLVKEGVGAEIDENKTRFPSFDAAALDDPKYDDDVYNSVNSAEFDSSKKLGGTDIGPLLQEDDFCFGSTLEGGNLLTSSSGAKDKMGRISDLSIDERDSISDKDAVDAAGQPPRDRKRDRIAKKTTLFGRKLKDTIEDVSEFSFKDKFGRISELSIDESNSNSDKDVANGGDQPPRERRRDRLTKKTMLFGRKLKNSIDHYIIDDDVAEGGDQPPRERKRDRFAKNTVLALDNLKGLARLSSSESSAEGPSLSSKPIAITSIAVLGDGHFLAASRTDNKIQMFKTVHRITDDNGSSDVEFVRDFRGHSSGVTALAVLDKKGRFLTAGRDLTVKLWDSRFDCADDSNEETMGNVPEPKTLLATFDNPDGRWVHSVGVLHEGSFVRPTDEIDGAMLAAMAKKTVFDGAASVQQAAIQREIIECSGSFVTASKNSSIVNVWDMHVAEENTDGSRNKNVAEIDLGRALEHEASIQSMATMSDKIITGDVMGDVYLWEYRRSSFGAIHKNWMKQRKFTPWRGKGPHSPAKITENMVLHLCFLNEGRRFIAGSNSGVIRVWDIEGTKKVDVVHKNDAQSVKVTCDSLSGIQQLPSVEDPNTGEKCPAFAVSSTDGRVVSMALHHPDSSKQERSELVIFHMNDYVDDVVSETDQAIHSIAVLEASTSSSNSRNSDHPIIIAGDGNGSINLSKPMWDSEC